MAELAVKNVSIQNRNAELCRIIQTQKGTEEARDAADELVRNNYDLVRKVALRMRGLFESSAVFSIDDAMQEGSMGLLQAAAKYDSSVAAFSTYAMLWIRQRIARAGANINNAGTGGLRIPESTLRAYRKFRREHRTMSDSEFFNTLKYDRSVPASMKETFLDIYFAQSMISLNQCVGDDNNEDDTELVEFMSSGESPEVEYMKKASIEATYEILDELNEREQWVLRHRFGIDEEWTLAECGERFPWGEVSRERVRQIETNAKKKIARKIQKSKYNFLKDEVR